MKLLVQPGDGVLSVVKGIEGARKSVEIVIFRFDQLDVERALADAITRGVSVHALIAHTNRAGEESLRKLELRLLAAGVTVARTADDLVRYHAKYMIIDRRELYVMAFNLTLLDTRRSRSFGVITRDRTLLAEAAELFEADTQRHPYVAEPGKFVVSPINARKQLANLIKQARKELLLYDLKVSDQAMIRLLEERLKAGVSIRIIGRMMQKIPGIDVRKMPRLRLHARAIVVDHRTAFIGSQSLREMELEARREVGVIFNDAKAVSALVKVFEDDWALTEQSANPNLLEAVPVTKVAKKVAKVISREIPEMMPVLVDAAKELVGEKADLELDPEEVQDVVEVAVKDAVTEALRDVVEEVVNHNHAATGGKT